MRGGAARTGTLEASAVYHVTDSISVDDDQVLTIAPGAVVKFEDGVATDVGFNGAGALVVRGDAKRVVTLTSTDTSPGADQWGGVALYGGTDTARTVFARCDLSAAGEGALGDAIIGVAAGVAPRVSDCRFHHADAAMHFADCDSGRANVAADNTIETAADDNCD